MKKRFRVLISLVLVVMLVVPTVNVFAEPDNIINGKFLNTCEDSFKYTLNTDTGEMVVNGYGKLLGNETDKYSIAGSVQFNEGLTVLAWGGFEFLEEGIETVYFPKTLKRVCDYTFTNCDLETVYYAGTEQEWQQVVIDDEKLASVENIIFEHTLPASEGEPKAEDERYEIECLFRDEKDRNSLILFFDYYTGELEVRGNGKLNSIYTYPVDKFDTYDERNFSNGFVSTLEIKDGITEIGNGMLFGKYKKLYIPSSVKKMSNNLGVNTCEVYYDGTKQEWENITFYGPYSEYDRTNHYELAPCFAGCNIYFKGEEQPYQSITGIEYNLSSHRVTYNGKYRTPSITNIKFKDINGERVTLNENDYTVSYENNKYPGYAVIKITPKDGTRYWGTGIALMEIKPQKQLISKITSSDKKTAKIYFKEYKKVSGYQIYYSTKKNFGSYKKVNIYDKTVNAKTIKTLSSGKTYYFKVRSFQKTDYGTVYGEWSTVKSKKIK